MLYLAYIHKDPGSAWGATFPDFPGCFTAADEIEDLPRMAQEAVETHFDGEDLPIPPPSAPEDWANDERFSGGYWMRVDVDLSKVGARARTGAAISLNQAALSRSLATRIRSTRWRARHRS